MGVSRQSLYQTEQRHQQREAVLEPVKAMVQEIRRRLPRLGTRKLYHLIKPELLEAGIKLGRDGLFEHLRQQRMLITPKRSYTKTTHSKHWMKKHLNLLANVEIHRPEQVLVSDITYLESDEGVHYLSLVTDACSRKIMGYELSHDLRAVHPNAALKQAIAQRVTDQPMIHHSDRGVQYCSATYQETLSKHHIQPSMTDGYDCYQNALAERVNGILKQEFLLYRCKTFEELKRLVDESVDAYNRLRPHLCLGMKTPQEVHEKADCHWQPA
jgi:transposase InsO family protein